MAKQNVNIGVEGNDGTGDSIRESFRKVNENFTELYAVFGIGGQISLTDLSDTPNSYEGNENKVPAVKRDGSGIAFLELASDNELNGTIDTIGFDFSVDGKLIVRQLVSKVSNDPEPILGGPLNAASQPIANVRITQAAIDTFNSVYGTDLSIDSLVIDKAYADRNYQSKDIAGGGLRLPDEPTSTNSYTLTVTNLVLGSLNIPSHGLLQAYNGAPFIFRSTGTDPFGVTTGGIAYVRVQDSNTISLHETELGAVNGTERILLSGGTGTFTITDSAYDTSLAGNFLNNVAIPRKSVVRRQGDTMTGILNLSDHPGELSGFGLPNGPDDLQAATKLYVDNAAATSAVNIFVAQNGDDRQTNTPVGKEGRNPAYAYRTINAAVRKAEEVILSSAYLPGPMMQTMTYNTGATASTILSAGISGADIQRTNARSLIIANKEFIQKEVTAFIDATYPSFAGTYDVEICQRDVGYILEAVTLDGMLGDNANYLSRWAGVRYYSSPSAKKAIGSQRTETIAGIEHARDLVQYILDYSTWLSEGANPADEPSETFYQTRVQPFYDSVNIPDPDAGSTYNGKFSVILDVINDGLLDAPAIVDGERSYRLNVRNGNFGFVDQASPENTDIIPGKVIRGRTSGALARIIDYRHESGDRPVSITETDEIEVQLLEPKVFLLDEELEYGNISREAQVTVMVESGVYEEDYPIRIPPNVTINGDEFRRSIIKPKRRVSQSRYATSFFYRDREFDGLVLGKSLIESVETVTPADANRVAGTYTIIPTQYSTSGYGKDATFEITVDGNGAITTINIVNSGKDWRVGDTIEILDDQLGEGGAPKAILTVTSVPNGVEYVNPLTGDIDGYFGYHYVADPRRQKNVGAGYKNIGKWETAALTLIDNKEFIQEQVVEYINNTYPAMIGNYSETKSKRDTGFIIDALVKDLRNGGNEFSLEMQGEFYDGSLGGINVDGCVAGMQYIHTIAESLLRGEEPAMIYGVDLEYPEADLYNGEADPDLWASSTLYRVGNVVKFVTGLGDELYFQCKSEHTSSSSFSLDQVTYWDEVFGPSDTISQLIGTVVFAFNEDYNPPKRNNEMDVFLMNDATRISNITVQGHGGFMCVLDPQGQVLTKSPYIQVAASFSQSVNKQSFRGGMYVDAFTGNSAVQVVGLVDPSDPFRVNIKSLPGQGLFIRKPETPSAFYIDGRRFQINACTAYDAEYGTAQLILDRSSNDGNGFSGITSNLITGVNLDAIGDFEFDSEICARDTEIMIQGTSYDLLFGTNYNAVTSGLAYQRGTTSAELVVSTGEGGQRAVTVNAIEEAKNQVLALSSVSSSVGITNSITAAFNEITDILSNGAGNADPLVWTDPGVDVNKRYARELLQANRAYIGTELTTWINSNYAGFTYDEDKCRRDVGYIVDALSYDIQYGGNTASINAAKSYFTFAVSVLPLAQRSVTAAAMAQLASIVSDIVTESYAGQTNTGTPASATEATEVESLVTIVKNVISSGTTNALPATSYPSTAWVAADLIEAKVEIDTNTAVIVRRVVQSVPSPLSVTLQTAGNRSILGNDFTQVNDLGYGLVAVNGALSEMVSMFTYYCWVSYYAKNGSQIRSITGSSCYGEYGLIAEGSDPNEIPDAVILVQDMAEPAKSFSADTILTLTGAQILTEGEEITQINTGATGTVVVSTSQVSDGGTGSYVIYLTDVNGAFDTSNELQITGPITGDSTVTNLGPTSVPISVDSTGYGNNTEQLYIHVYDMANAPSNRAEIDLWHPVFPAFARYEVANVTKINHILGGLKGINSSIPTTNVIANGSAIGAVFTVYKSIDNGYGAVITTPGTDYTVGDTFTLDGTYMGGTSGSIGIGNDAIVEVTEVDPIGAITAVSVTGNIFVDASTPKKDGQVYKLSFSTSDVRYQSTGLLEAVSWGDDINFRRNQTHILGDIVRPDVLSIRPSTAVIFDENPDQIYRSISFLGSDSLGTLLSNDQSQAGFDTGYDFIRLVIDSAKAQEVALSGTGTTKGGTIGDTVLALQVGLDDNEIFRLNNNARTPIENRPLGWSTATLVEAPMTTWGGKKYYVYNYRAVNAGNIIGPVSDSNEYGIVDLLEIPGSDINITPVVGLSRPVVLGNETITLRAGLKSGATGNVTVNISTCRATGHDFLDVGTGGFNQSNYPNFIYGLPRESDQAKEVIERGAGRVFYVSTDQNGIFRVGRFFSVDQGTGTVTFSASLALSDVDGLGFKRGVVITEFSTDSAMTDNASDTVPTESAVRGYVNRRLGYDVNGTAISNPLGPGVLAPNGAVPMTDDLNAAGNSITNLRAPTSNSDAATKAYVDAAQANSDSLYKLRDVELNNIAASQVLLSTGFKKVIVTNIDEGPFEVADIVQTPTGAGNVIDVLSVTSYEGNSQAIIYTPTSGQFETGQNLTVYVNGNPTGTRGAIVDGPMDEWANGVWDTGSDVSITATRALTGTGVPSARQTNLSLQIRSNSVVNSDISASAGILQSKLTMNKAATLANSTGITQNDLGVAAFSSTNFTTDNGFVSLKDGGITLTAIEDVATKTVVGRSAASTGPASQISFSTVVHDGGGLEDNDFTVEVPTASDPGNALIKTGTGIYGYTNVSKTGEVNSIVKTDANGSIQVNSLKLGGSSTYEVLSLDTTTLVIKTPAQGEILRAVGGSGGASPTYPDLQIPGNVNISGTGINQSVLQTASNFAGEKRLGVDWIYSSFIEAPGERTQASTGIAIGANTGKTTAGQVAIVTADSATSSSVVPMKFSSAGALPDTDNIYNIGSATLKYANVYATTFRGTATESYYADLAENYLGDNVYEPGTVLVFGGEAEVTTTIFRGDRRVAGVVTTNPAHLMNSELTGDNVTGIALQGRVPCKVLGRVKKGDLLVSAAIPGYATVNNEAEVGTVIGKALENKESPEKGVIEIVVGKH